MFTGSRSGNREDELMAALQLLLDRLNSGNLPVNQTFLEQLQKGASGVGTGITTDTTDVRYAPGSLVGTSVLYRKRIYIRIKVHLTQRASFTCSNYH